MLLQVPVIPLNLAVKLHACTWNGWIPDRTLYGFRASLYSSQNSNSCEVGCAYNYGLPEATDPPMPDLAKLIMERGYQAGLRVACHARVLDLCRTCSLIGAMQIYSRSWISLSKQFSTVASPRIPWCLFKLLPAKRFLSECEIVGQRRIAHDRPCEESKPCLMFKAFPKQNEHACRVMSDPAQPDLD